jgi:phosphate transport system substrate-binding protein
MAMQSNQLRLFSTAVAATGMLTGLMLSVVPSSVQAQTVVKVDGSSTVFPIAEAAAELFQKANSAVRVTVGVSGTGAGFKKFCSGETDISNASRPILQKEMDACKSKGISYIELPVAYDGIVVVVNPQNSWAKDLTTAELKKIWEPGSKIKNWSEVRKGFPNVPLKLFGPGPQSGTFDYFTEAIVGKAKASRTDYTPSEDDNVLVQGVSRDRGGLGYFGKSYLEENKDKIRAVTVNGVAANDQTVSSAKYQPLSRPLFIYVSTKSAGKPEVSKFVTYWLQNGARISKEARYTQLPSNLYPQILSNFGKRKTGTVFGGTQDVGLTIQELVSKESR